MPIDFRPIEDDTSVTTIDFQPEEKPRISEIFSKLATLPIEPLKHPEYLTQPISKSIGKETPKEFLTRKFEQKKGGERFAPAFLRSLGVQTIGDIGDIATTPLSYILPEVTEAAIATKPAQMFIRKQMPKLGQKLFRPITPSEEAYQMWLKKPTISPTVKEVISGKAGQNQAIQTVMQALKEAKPIRGKQEVLYTTERRKRIAQVIEAGKVGGEQAYFKQLGALKGELPKVQFERIRGKISQLDIDNLFNTIEQNQVLSPFEKITTKTGLAKLLGTEGGVVPTKGELSLLGEVFPQDFIDTILTKRPLLQKVGQGIAEVLNVPRAIMTSVDMSAPLRQGIFLIGKPKQWFLAFKEQFKYFFSEKAYQGLMEDIQKRPTYALMRESRLPLTNLGVALSSREEKFMSNLAEKIPFVGKLVRASGRAYTGFLNKLRADVFDDLVKSAQKQGIKVEGKILGDIAKFLGSATGRGDLGTLNNATVALNSVFFSPRLMASRLNLLNPAYYIKLDPVVRKEALKSLFTFSGTVTSIITLAKLGGANVGIEPRSADFGKIKIGNTRYDILGGFQQYIRLAVQLITGEHISSTTGVKTTVGEGYKPLTRLGILGRFIETKEAPVTSFALNLMRGQTTFGQELEIPKEIGQLFVPMVIQDMYDLYKERGLEGIAMGTPAIFGAGVQTYAPTAQEMVYSANSVLTNYKELVKQGKKDEAKNLLNKNREIINTGKKLEPYQKTINFYEKLKDNVTKNVRLSSEQKKQKILNYNQKIKDLQNKMEMKYKEYKETTKIDFQPEI